MQLAFLILYMYIIISPVLNIFLYLNKNSAHYTILNYEEKTIILVYKQNINLCLPF